MAGLTGCGAEYIAPAETGGCAPDGAPNVVMVIADQMRHPSYFSNEKLPNFEKIKSIGVEFTNHFVAAVPCSPSRACLMTGLTPEESGLKVNVDNGHRGLNPHLRTLGHLFKNMGYKTAYCGKWHLSDTTPGDLSAYGFDEYLSSDIPDLEVTGRGQDCKYVKRATAWIEKQTKPYFIVVSLINPHDITKYPEIDPEFCTFEMPIKEVPENWNEDLTYKPSVQLEYKNNIEKRKDLEFDRDTILDILNYYYYLNLKVDAQLGEIFDSIDTKGTLFIFTSDHGDMCGSHGLIGKGPFAYKEQTHVPMLMVWDGKITAGSEVPGITSNIDVYSTLAAMFGKNINGKGQDMFSPISEDREVEFWYYGSVMAGADYDKVRATRSLTKMEAIYSNGDTENYDLVTDPNENEG